MFVDSWGDAEFIDLEFAKTLKIQTQPTLKKQEVFAIDGHIIHPLRLFK